MVLGMYLFFLATGWLQSGAIGREVEKNEPATTAGDKNCRDNPVREISSIVFDQPNNRYILLNGQHQLLGSVYGFAKDQSCASVKVSRQNDYVEVDSRDYGQKSDDSAVMLRFYLRGFNTEKKKIRTSVDISSPDKGGVLALRLEGYHDPKGETHFWKERGFPVGTRTMLEFSELVPYKLSSIRASLIFKTPGVYRIYDAAIEEENNIGVAMNSTTNHILNGGAERGWYGTGMTEAKFLRLSEDDTIYDGLGHTWNDTFKPVRDNQVKHSGKYSFRLLSDTKLTGRFVLNPVPFVPGCRATLTAWIKGDRPKQRAGLELFLGSGITQGKGFWITDKEWTKCELDIPQWGENIPGGFNIGDVVNGYAAVNRIAFPCFSTDHGSTIWIDDVSYNLGEKTDFKSPPLVTAYAVLDSEQQYYRPGTPVNATLKLSNLSARPETAAITWEIKDFFGKTIKKSETHEKIVLPPGGDLERDFVFSLPEHLRGVFNIVFEVNGETTGLYLGIIDQPGDPDSRIGINFDNGCNQLKAIAMLKEFGFGTVRLWNNYRKEANFGYRNIDYFYSHGFQVMMCIEPPGHIAPRHVLPLDLEPWRREVVTLAEKYRGKVNIYELHNEPDFLTGREKNPDTANYESMSIPAYVRMLQALAPAIKNADPHALIGGPATHDIKWALSILAITKGAFPDVITEHAYRPIPEFPDYDAELTTLKQSSEKFGKNYPIVQSEAGACSATQYPDNNLIPDFERNRVAYNIRMMLIGFANGLSGYHHFNYNVSMPGTGWIFTLWGNPDNHGVPIPAPIMFACRNVADRLKNTGEARRIKIGSNYKCYIFDSGDARVCTLWKWSGKKDSGLVTSGWNNYVAIWEGNRDTMRLTSALRDSSRLYDIMGSRILSDQFELGPYPCFIESTMSTAQLEQELRAAPILSLDDKFDAEFKVLDRNRFVVRVRNLSSSIIEGKVTCNGLTKSFLNIPLESFADIEFQAPAPIALREQPVKAEVAIKGQKQPKVITHNMQHLDVIHTAKPLSIDGDLSDWPQNTVIFPLEKSTSLNENFAALLKSVRADARLAWDDNFLYLAVTVYKRGYTAPELGPSSLYFGDSIQVAFDPLVNAGTGQRGYQDDDFEYAAALWQHQPCVYASAVSSAKYDSFSKSIGVNKEVQCSIRVLPEHTIYEMAFPRLSVSPFRLEPGASMKLNILVNVASSAGRIGYLQLTTGIGDNPKQPGLFIDVTMQK